MLIWSESQVHSFIIDERINASLVNYMQQLPNWINILAWDIFGYVAGHPCRCCSEAREFLCECVYVCVGFSASLTVKEKEQLFFQLRQSLRCSAAVACCHGNLLILRQSFLTTRGGRHFLATDKSIGHSWRKSGSWDMWTLLQHLHRPEPQVDLNHLDVLLRLGACGLLQIKVSSRRHGDTRQLFSRVFSTLAVLSLKETVQMSGIKELSFLWLECWSHSEGIGCLSCKGNTLITNPIRPWAWSHAVQAIRCPISPLKRPF